MQVKFKCPVSLKKGIDTHHISLVSAAITKASQMLYQRLYSVVEVSSKFSVLFFSVQNFRNMYFSWSF